jgi:hypothetical protein
LQAFQPVQVLGQLMQANLLRGEVWTRQSNAVHMLAVLAEVQDNTIWLLRRQHNTDAAGDKHGCLVQPAVGSHGAEQTVKVISTAAQCQ